MRSCFLRSSDQTNKLVRYYLHLSNSEFEYTDRFIPDGNIALVFNFVDNNRVYDSYHDSKMALLILTLKMAQVFNDDGIKVNSIQINGAKMSKATLNKFTLKWRIIAMIQNLFFPPADFMAEKYFEICTSDKFKDVTGKLINHKLEIMEPAKNNNDSKSEFAKVFGAKYYADYAEDESMINKVWNICEEFTGVNKL